jgi:bifunctional non-homologous end joining protein LigD
MRATPGTLPDGSGWAYEMSWNGPRLLVDITSARVVARDESERDVTIRYPELVAMAADIDDALVDGHLVSVGDAPISFVVTDLLRLYGVDLTPRPYSERRRSLDRLAARHPLLTVSPTFDDADATRSAADQHGLAGVIAKRLNSSYRPGTMSTDWIEHRFPRRSIDGGARG